MKLHCHVAGLHLPSIPGGGGQNFDFTCTMSCYRNADWNFKIISCVPPLGLWLPPSLLQPPSSCLCHWFNGVKSYSLLFPSPQKCSPE